MISIKRVRLSESIVDALKNMIVEEKFQPGDRFYSEHRLAVMLGVSRASIREAVKILEVSGKVLVLQGKGIFIAPEPPASEGAPSSLWFQENEKSLLDHFEARILLEERTAGYAAEHADPQSIGDLEQAHDAFSREVVSGKTAVLIGADKIFHQIVARMSGNRTLYSLMKLMTTSLSEGWITSLNVPGRAEKTVEEHGAVLNAIREKDGKEAGRAMRLHLTHALQDIRRTMGIYPKEEALNGAEGNGAGRE